MKFERIGWLAGVMILCAMTGKAENRYFVGTGNWNTTASWSTSSGGGAGASVPGSSDNAIFDGSSGDCTINAAANVLGMLLDAGYGNTVTQSGAYTINVGTNHYTQNNGTFAGGSGDITISSTGDFTLNGGSFTAPSGTIWVGHNVTILGGTFIHNNGTVAIIDWGNTGTATLNAPGVTFYDFDFRANGYRSFRMTNTCTVARNLYNTTTPPTPSWGSGVSALGPASITLLGNFLETNTTYTFAVPLVLTNAVDQDIGIFSGTMSGALTVNKPSGVVTIRGPGVYGGGLTILSGVVTASVATLNLPERDVFLNTNTIFTITESSGSTPFVGKNVTVESNALFQILGVKSITIAESNDGRQFLVKTNGIFKMNGGLITTYNFRNLSTLCALTNVSIVWGGWGTKLYDTGNIWSNMTIRTAGNNNATLYGDFIVMGDLTVRDISSGPYSGNLVSSGTRTIQAGRNFLVKRDRTDVGSVYGDDALTVLMTGANGTLCESNGAIWSGRLGVTNNGVATLVTNFIMNAARIVTVYPGSTLNLAGYAITSGTMTVSGTLRLQGGEPLSPATPTLNAGSTVRYDGAASPVTVKAWSYRNLSLQAPGKQLNWTAGTTYTVAEGFIANGGTLRSTTPTAYWYLNLGGSSTQNVQNVDVQDSDASGGKTVRAFKSIDSGRTLNWLFPMMGTIMQVR